MKYNIKSKVLENGIIETLLIPPEEYTFLDKFTKWIVDTRDEQIRESLIALGWSPPENKQVELTNEQFETIVDVLNESIYHHDRAEEVVTYLVNNYYIEDKPYKYKVDANLEAHINRCVNQKGKSDK